MVLTAHGHCWCYEKHPKNSSTQKKVHRAGFLTGYGDLKRFFITYNDCYNRNAVNKLQVDPTELVYGLQSVNSSQPDDKSKYGNTCKE